MKTRSQTLTDSYKIPVSTQTTPKYEVNIDFDEASRAWYANKKRMSNAMCKYICVGKTKNGRACCSPPLFQQNYCSIHFPK